MTLGSATFPTQRFTDFADNSARAMVVLCAFAIAMPTAVMSIATGLLLLFWLLGADFRSKLMRLWENPVALSALLLLVLLSLGLLYSSAEGDGAIEVYNKYKKLLIVLLIISLGLNAQWRKRAILAFAISMTIVLCMSYLKYFQLLPYGPIGEEYTVFKGRIAHGTFMAFYFYLLIHAAIIGRNWPPLFRLLCVVLAIAACHNLIFLNTGRTGYVVFASLLFLLCYQHFKWRGFLIALLSLSIVAGLAFFASDNFRNRINDSVSEYAEHVPGEYGHFSGLRYRLEFYELTSELIAGKPILGYGTGALGTEYRRLAEPRNMFLTDNPHNEFMMITVQLGVVGLAAILWMLYAQWFGSFRLEEWERLVVQGVIVTFVSGSMLNSMLLDSGEGKFYMILIGVMFSAAGMQAKSRAM